ncbi:hypothetical protein PGT21_020213 [Puccinia graminis f. sp. tritici]|uniref:Uncharacterized protein n=1 Tax=Puccinia graminis f. sp. tritici TaxID=56615 RepID=A0A5B0RIM6_PUCGR|nr:hypothetical protein PGT21_020213 [Puccinia graminis f. sp. tritici]KAA1125841.1 hypothetical protein PGTUg99_006681 [Puccinia graminis f. sp. tritici]
MSTQSTNNRTADDTGQPTRRQFGWERDGVNGGLRSIQLLLLWMTGQGNYARWWATTFDQRKREDVCTKIQEFFQIQGNIRQDTQGTINQIAHTSGDKRD